MGYIMKYFNINKLKQLLKMNLNLNKFKNPCYDTFLIKKIRKGDVEQVKLDIDFNVIDRQHYQYLSAIVAGCEASGDIHLLWKLFVLVEQKLNYCDVSHFYPTKNSAIRAIQEADLLNDDSFSDRTYQNLIAILSTHTHYFYRDIMVHILEVADSLADYNKSRRDYDKCKLMLTMQSYRPELFINHVAEKILFNLQALEHRWLSYSQEDKNAILYLSLSLENGLIQAVPDMLGGSSINFHSSLFKEGQTGYIYLHQFDVQLGVKNKMVLAEFLYRFIQSKDAVLVNDQLFSSLAKPSVYIKSKG